MLNALLCIFFPTSLRSKFPHNDMSTNPGYVLSPVITQRDCGGDSSCSVKVSIEISDSKQPVTFTCDGKHPAKTVCIILTVCLLTTSSFLCCAHVIFSHTITCALILTPDWFHWASDKNICLGPSSLCP